MTTRTDIEARVRDTISELLGINIASITAESTLESLDADSLDRVEIILGIEDRFLIEIPDEEAEPLTSVALMVDYVAKRLQVSA